VAEALGPAAGPRAIVAYDGVYGTGPLSVYLARSSQSSAATVSVAELDVVGDIHQSVAGRLPGEVRLLGQRTVHGYRVARFGVPAARPLNPETLAPSLLGPEPAGVGATLIQRAG
jgi:hypothetical protein